MLDIFVSSIRTIALKESIVDAVESGQYGSLADDIRDCFTEDQVEQIEELLDSGDLDETIDNVLSDWSGENLEELLEELKEIFSETGIDLSFDDESSEPEDVLNYDDDDEDFTDDDDEEFASDNVEEEEEY